MGIIIGKETRVVVQGITGTQGSFHTQLMLDYGTSIAAGVTPGKGGTEVFNVPVYDTVKEAILRHDVNASIIFVPQAFAAEAALEAIEAGIKTVAIITEHIPLRDTIEVLAHAKRKRATIIGPNTPGIITPGECKLGIMPSHVFRRGTVGIASRSGTLTYEIAAELTRHGFGQSTCIGLGGDSMVGLSFVDVLKLFNKDRQTKEVVLIGEIGGNAEEQAAEYIATNKFSKRVVSFVAGRTAPSGKRMGHAGAIVMGCAGTAEGKIEAFRAAGIGVAAKISDVRKLLTREIRGKAEDC